MSACGGERPAAGLRSRRAQRGATREAVGSASRAIAREASSASNRAGGIGRFADLPSGLRLHYHEAGDPSAETVLLLHGGGPGASAWSNFGRTLGGLADRVHVLAVDQLGFGGSSKPAEFARQYFAASADAIAELLDNLEIGRAH